MILGTGIDMIEVDRVAEKIANGNGFREKVFSVEEIAFCEKTANPGQHYAARFAAKEAFLKATGKGLQLGFDLHMIEVISNDEGKPGIRLGGSYREIALKNNWTRIHVSLSHVKDTACAVVIIES